MVSEGPDGKASRVDTAWIVKGYSIQRKKHEPRRKYSSGLGVAKEGERERSTVGLGYQVGEFVLYYRGKTKPAEESQAGW